MASAGLYLPAEAHISFGLANKVALEKIVTASDTALSKAPAMEKKVSVIIDFDSDEAVDAAMESGLEITSRFGTHVFASVPVDRVEEIDAMPGVKRIGLSGSRRLLNDTTRKISSVDEVHNGVDLPASYHGEDVVVGLYDTGLDASHISFKDSVGEQRIKKLWCFPLYSGWQNDVEKGKTPPPGKDVNIYSTPEMIASFTTDDSSESHGSHVLGTAAGSYAISQSKDFRGMAPASELAVACGRLDDLSILRGVDSVATYADSVGKRCVINLSLGSNEGPHDGTDPFTTVLNEIASRDNVTICVAAGNEGSDNISLVKEFTESDTVLRTFVVNGYGGADVDGTFQVWSNDSTPFRLYLDIVNPSQNVDVPLLSYNLPEGSGRFLVTKELAGKVSGDTALINLFSEYFVNSRMGGSLGLDPSNNRYGAEITADLNSKSSNRIMSLRVEGRPGQKIFVYSPSTDDAVFTSKGKFGFDSPDGNGSINTIACGPNTIAVGAYNGHGGGTALAYFTSWSDMYDGSRLPHIAAPGVDVTSTMSKYYYADHSYQSVAIAKVNGKAYHWFSISGTSMATPAMTGIAALWWSANPELTSDRIREIAISTATAPSGNFKTAWGAGKVNAYEGLKTAIGINSIANVTSDGSDGILVGNVGERQYEISAPGETSLTVELYDLQGRLVLSEKNTDQVIVDLSSFQPGVYVVKASTNRGVKTFKLY